MNKTYRNHINLSQNGIIVLLVETYIRDKDRKVNGLCKRLYQKMKIKNNNKNQKLMNKEQVWSLIETVVKGLQVEPIRRIRGKYEKVVMVVKEIKKIGVKTLKGDK